MAFIDDLESFARLLDFFDKEVRERRHNLEKAVEQHWNQYFKADSPSFHREVDRLLKTVLELNLKTITLLYENKLEMPEQGSKDYTTRKDLYNKQWQKAQQRLLKLQNRVLALKNNLSEDDEDVLPVKRAKAGEMPAPLQKPPRTNRKKKPAPEREPERVVGPEPDVVKKEAVAKPEKVVGPEPDRAAAEPGEIPQEETERLDIETGQFAAAEPSEEPETAEKAESEELLEAETSRIEVELEEMPAIEEEESEDEISGKELELEKEPDQADWQETGEELELEAAADLELEDEQVEEEDSEPAGFDVEPIDSRSYPELEEDSVTEDLEITEAEPALEPEDAIAEMEEEPEVLEAAPGELVIDEDDFRDSSREEAQKPESLSLNGEEIGQKAKDLDMKALDREDDPDDEDLLSDSDRQAIAEAESILSGLSLDDDEPDEETEVVLEEETESAAADEPVEDEDMGKTDEEAAESPLAGEKSELEAGKGKKDSGMPVSVRIAEFQEKLSPYKRVYSEKGDLKIKTKTGEWTLSLPYYHLEGKNAKVTRLLDVENFIAMHNLALKGVKEVQENLSTENGDERKLKGMLSKLQNYFQKLYFNVHEVIGPQGDRIFPEMGDEFDPDAILMVETNINLEPWETVEEVMAFKENFDEVIAEPFRQFIQVPENRLKYFKSIAEIGNIE